MIRSVTAATREIDDAEAAVAEITAALGLEKNLRKNSLGIISCFSEFADTGVLKAVCDALPFDCVGATTCLCAARAEIDQIILTVTVLTSDDCDFQTAGIPIGDNYENSVNSALTALLAQNGKPALFLSYFPLMNTISGDMMLTAIDKATGGIPLFGTTALDHTMDYSTAQTVYNGEAFREKLVLAAVCGAPNISFHIASLDETKFRSQKALITASDGNILIGVNGKTALEYLEEIGLTKAELASGLGVIPLVVDHKDGTEPVVRAVFALTPDGHAVCGGAMPVGATLTIGRVDRNDVLRTTENTVKPLADQEGVVLSYSCIARYLVLGADNAAEAEKVRAAVGEAPYLFACSGGEICPLLAADGRLKNFYHNYTNVFCKMS
ncbi:MAG: FIST C-terminal domain-containing protein [Gracilibacteraceae bacterium]|jgi:hypothetical protein|nr:FIST C-terminal domain-containing protein [Gracilibacteraceae bacterium]